MTFLHKTGPKVEEEREDGRATASQNVRNTDTHPRFPAHRAPGLRLTFRVGSADWPCLSEDPTDLRAAPAGLPPPPPAPPRQSFPVRERNPPALRGVRGERREQALFLLLLLSLQRAGSLGRRCPSPGPVSCTRAAGRESQPPLLPEYSAPGTGSIFIPNLVSWWAHKLLPVKIATAAKMSPICLDVLQIRS